MFFLISLFFPYAKNINSQSESTQLKSTLAFKATHNKTVEHSYNKQNVIVLWFVCLYSYRYSRFYSCGVNVA